MISRIGILPATALALVLAAAGHANPGKPQDPSAQQNPLAVIDWLGKQAPSRAGDPAQPKPPAKEPPVAESASPPAVTVAPLGQGQPREIGLVPSNVTGLPVRLWYGSEVKDVIRRIERLPNLHLPAARSLLYTLLLADALAPNADAAAGDKLAVARVSKLVDLGALDPALSLIEQAGVTTSQAHFDLWMEISLLTGHEDRACATLAKSPHLTLDYGTRIFCHAREGRWDDAALTLGSAQALGLMPEPALAVFDRFLYPDAYEGKAPLSTPRDMDPMLFRLFETIGEPKSTRSLPRAYAVADLRDIAGWKAQLEAAERLTRVGALPDNVLLGLYTAREPAASGGVWDRVDAFQRLEAALREGDDEAVAERLPAAWSAMQDAELETTFAALFAESLMTVDLDGEAQRISLTLGLLSPAYEQRAAATPQIETALPDGALLRAVAMGEAPDRRPAGDMAAAIHDAFAAPDPRQDLVALAGKDQLGLAILQLLGLLNDGAGGDAAAFRSALSTLRALGLEDTARRAALQMLLLDRNA